MNDLQNQLDAAGVQIVHHMPDDGSGVYIKETHIPAGVFLGMHSHTFTHKSVLVSGHARLFTDGVEKDIHAPRVLSVNEDVQHSVQALSPCVWLCIHHTNETDASKIDNTLIKRG